MQLYCFYVIVDQIFGLGNPDPFLIKLHVFYYDFVIYYIMYSNIHYSSLFCFFYLLGIFPTKYP